MTQTVMVVLFWNGGSSIFVSPLSVRVAEYHTHRKGEVKNCATLATQVVVLVVVVVAVVVVALAVVAASLFQ
jgi:hypothetical protein